MITLLKNELIIIAGFLTWTDIINLSVCCQTLSKRIQSDQFWRYLLVHHFQSSFPEFKSGFYLFKQINCGLLGVTHTNEIVNCSKYWVHPKYKLNTSKTPLKSGQTHLYISVTNYPYIYKYQCPVYSNSIIHYVGHKYYGLLYVPPNKIDAFQPEMISIFNTITKVKINHRIIIMSNSPEHVYLRQQFNYKILF